MMMRQEQVALGERSPVGLCSARWIARSNDISRHIINLSMKLGSTSLSHSKGQYLHMKL
jgi:hypothetical protein